MSVNALDEILAAEQKARLQKDAALAEAKTIAAKAEADGKKILAESEARASEEVGKIKAAAEKEIAAVNTASEAKAAQKLAELRRGLEKSMSLALDYIIEQLS